MKENAKKENSKKEDSQKEHPMSKEKKTWKKLAEEILFEFRMWRIDEKWRRDGRRGCFEVYPPSFFLRHTPEEARRIQQETADELTQKINAYMERIRDSEMKEMSETGETGE